MLVDLANVTTPTKASAFGVVLWEAAVGLFLELAHCRIVSITTVLSKFAFHACVLMLFLTSGQKQTNVFFFRY